MKISIIVLILMNSQCDGGRDWCDLSCEKGGRNTMCKYTPQTSIKDCKGITDSQTPSGRKDILHLHNKYREELASGMVPGWPTASNMMQLSWDHEIEAAALRWAQQCTEGHDDCRRTHSFIDVGQNYGMEGSTVTYPSSRASFKGWIDGISLVKDPKSLRASYKGGKWGHFTQVVWALSYKLGCGEIHTMQGWYMKTILICNYGPAGNVLQSKMYEEGEPCTKCPVGTACRAESTYPSLCAFARQHRNPVDIYWSRVNIATRPSFGFLRVTIIFSMVTTIFGYANL